MHVDDVFDIVGGLLTIALVATILNKPNLAKDVQVGGSTFTSALHEAKA